MVRCVAFAALALALVLAQPVHAASSGGQTAVDRLAVARDWVAAHPDDAKALRVMGRQLYDLERYAEAAEALALARRIQPADPDPILHLATLVRLGRMDEARALAAVTKDAPPADALRRVAAAMARAGELGRARMLLDTALARAPDDVGLLVARASVESVGGHPVRAVATLEKAVSLAPLDASVTRALVGALHAAGLPVRAVQASEAARKAGLVPDEGLLVTTLAAMQSTGAHRAAVALADENLDRFRKSAPVLRALAVSLAALGSIDKAESRLREALALAPPDQAALDLLRTKFPQIRSEALLHDLRRRFPWMPDLFATGGTPPRDQAWTWLREAERMERAAAAAHLARGIGELSNGRRGARATLALRAAGLGTDVEAALARLALAESLDAARGEVLAARTSILVGASRWDAAAGVAWDWARTRPDDADALATLFLPEIAERVGWARVFAHLHDHVQRDPEAADRRLRALGYHAGTGGSAVLALSHAQALERMADGDHEEGRRLRTTVTRSIEAVGRLVDMDFAQARMVLEIPQGHLEVRFHPVTGRLVRFALGERWIAAEWSPDGLDLLALVDGAGNRLSVQRRDGRLVSVEATGKAAFRAEVGADGAPSGIAIESGDRAGAMEAYNAGLALLSAWPRTGLAGARWLKIGR